MVSINKRWDIKKGLKSGLWGYLYRHEHDEMETNDWVRSVAQFFNVAEFDVYEAYADLMIRGIVECDCEGSIMEEEKLYG